MGDRYDISVDAAEGKDKTFATLFRIGEDGKYIPLAVSDAISFGSDVEHSGYVGVEAGEYTFSAKVVDMKAHEILYRLCGLHDEWERLSEALDKTIEAWTKFVCSCEHFRGKRRKTTYKTIRRNCAKRNKNN